VHDINPARQQRLQQASDAIGRQAPASDSQTGLPDALSGLGFAACLLVPLRAHGRILGNLYLLRSAARPAFSREEADLVEELALRSALALENARLHRELQHAVSLRDEVLAATSHDLRSPLSGIMLQGALLRRLLRTDPASPDADVHAKVIRGLDDIDAAIGRSLGLIQELLDAASLEAGRELQLDRRQTDLVELARRAIADHQARTTSYTFDLQVAGGPLVGDWDAQRLIRVLDNLLGNAVKYGGLRAIRVGLDREITAEGAWALLQVRDQGVGIPAAELERVFDRFYRGSNVVRQKRGVGIGLSGVRQIVEQHGGCVAVQSEEGIGSTFTVRLPLGAAG
jgi:signal transduction histidine kinase